MDKTLNSKSMNILSQIPLIKNIESGNFFLIAGPCVVEDTESPMEIAKILVELSDKYQIPFIFKASYRKANRSKSSSREHGNHMDGYQKNLLLATYPHTIPPGDTGLDSPHH